MKLEERIILFSKLGDILGQKLENGQLDSIINLAQSKNPWFTKDNIKLSISGILKYFLSEPKIVAFVNKYPDDYFNPSRPFNVGIVAAGNLPLVCFQDVLQVLIAGHKVLLKPSSQDEVLIGYLRELMVEIEPQVADYFNFSDRLNITDAVIATGSGNTSRYFEYYFANKPNIIRKNRNSVAVISGNETKTQLSNLGDDIFSYFGLGCRNVSHMFVPQGYDFSTFFESIEYWNIITMHSKYNNNYEYMKSIYLVNRESHLDNGFLLLKESEAVASPISVLFFQYYSSLDQVKTWLKINEDQVQVVVSSNPEISNIPLGKTQNPELNDYADNLDVIEFLNKVSY
jgi:hypothetical protein